jgi:peptidoglycan/LPS O-acetylase OafA/YrhL
MELFQYLNIGLLITIVMLSYFLIGLFFNKGSQLTKQLLTLAVAVVISLIYYFLLETPLQEIFPTVTSAIVVYDYLVKGLLRKLKVDYENLSDEKGKL